MLCLQRVWGIIIFSITSNKSHLRGKTTGFLSIINMLSLIADTLDIPNASELAV